MPVALIYGAVVRLRNWLYHRGFYKSIRFEVPVISVGNLTVGGAGKSPYIEYLLRLLSNQYQTATLSRGYGRKSSGFQLATAASTAADIGDEPRQFRLKFPNVIVSVAESRMLAIPDLLGIFPGLDVILLDDAFQHRSVRPGLSILLTEYDDPFTRDRVLPLGRLREPRSGYKRADIIIVSKCPAELGHEERHRMIAEINPYPHQKVYFSSLRYQTPYSFTNPEERLSLNTGLDVILLSGIAKTANLEAYLQQTCRRVFVRQYRDHHEYDRYDMEQLRQAFESMESDNKIVITTEKDATRLEPYANWMRQLEIPCYVLPIEVVFHAEDKAGFEQDIKEFMQYSLDKLNQKLPYETSQTTA